MDMVELCLRLTSKKERSKVFHDNPIVSAAFQTVSGSNFEVDCPPMLKTMNDTAKENQT
jgi:hypothetical protein